MWPQQLHQSEWDNWRVRILSFFWPVLMLMPIFCAFLVLPFQVPHSIFLMSAEFPGEIKDKIRSPNDGRRFSFRVFWTELMARSTEKWHLGSETTKNTQTHRPAATMSWLLEIECQKLRKDSLLSCELPKYFTLRLGVYQEVLAKYGMGHTSVIFVKQWFWPFILIVSFLLLTQEHWY